MTPLDNQLRALRDAEAQTSAPAYLERAVLAAWDAEHPRRNAAKAFRPPENAAKVGPTKRADEPALVRRVAARRDPRPSSAEPSRSSSWTVWRGMTAAAAAVTLAFTLAVLGGRLRAGLDGAASTAPDSQTLLLVGEPIFAGEPVRVVRMRVPTSSLAALGVRSVAGEYVDAVDVDVIVGEDGVARAIRLGM